MFFVGNIYVFVCHNIVFFGAENLFVRVFVWKLIDREHMIDEFIIHKLFFYIIDHIKKRRKKKNSTLEYFWQVFTKQKINIQLFF